MNCLGLGFLPKKLSIVGIIFGIANLWAWICCANWSSKIVFLLELLNPQSNCSCFGSLAFSSSERVWTEQLSRKSIVFTSPSVRSLYGHKSLRIHNNVIFDQTKHLIGFGMEGVALLHPPVWRFCAMFSLLYITYTFKIYYIYSIYWDALETPWWGTEERHRTY